MSQQTKNILILCESELISNQLYHILKQGSKSKYYLAHDMDEAESYLKSYEIDTILADFSIAKNYKSKVRKYCTYLEKSMPKYLVINSHLIISKKSNSKKKDEGKFVIPNKKEEKGEENVLTFAKTDPRSDISLNTSELYERHIGLETKVNGTPISCEFLEMTEDSLILSSKNELEEKKEYEFIISNLFDREREPHIIKGIAYPEQNDDQLAEAEDVFIYEVKISKESLKDWKRELEAINEKQQNALKFIKAAND